jgi:hypothetical protein
MPGRFAEGPRSPGFILPASAVSEQENYGGSRTANLCCIQGLKVQTPRPVRETDYFSSSPRRNS